MLNQDRYKTPEERINAFRKYCKKTDCADCQISNLPEFDKCAFGWLAIEAEEEKPESCPFCNRETMSRHLAGGFCVECDCGYTSPFAETEAATIAAHNRVCKAVAAYKESEVVK